MTKAQKRKLESMRQTLMNFDIELLFLKPTPEVIQLKNEITKAEIKLKELAICPLNI